MQTLLGDCPGIDTFFLHQLFLQRLPPNVRMVLASSPDGTTLDQLADMADKVMEVASPSVASLSKPPAYEASPSPAVADELRQLRSDVSWLGKLLN